MDIVTKLISRVKIDEETGCWIWQGAKNNKGYGKIGVNYKGWLVHRLSYSLFRGEIPPGILVCHKCDVRLCCLPLHLFLGTHQDNLDDAIAKKRHHNGCRKLSDEQVISLTERYAAGERSTDLAKEYGISSGNVYSIATGRSFKSVARPFAKPQRPDRKNNKQLLLSASDIIEIEKSVSAGERVVNIAMRYNVSKATVYLCLKARKDVKTHA